MRIANASSGRPAFYDRTPLAKQFSYQSVGQIPVGASTRWTYTVPTGKKAQLTMISMQIVRATAAAPAGEVRAEIEYTPLAGGTAEMISHRVVDNTLGTLRSIVEGGSILLLAGDVIDAVSGDASTGGTNNFNIAASLNEFDA